MIQLNALIFSSLWIFFSTMYSRSQVSIQLFCRIIISIILSNLQDIGQYSTLSIQHIAVSIKVLAWHEKYTKSIIKKVTYLLWIWKYCNLSDLEIPLPTMYHMYMFVMKHNTKNGIVWAKNGHFRPVFVRNANFDNFELWYILS